MNYLPQYFTYSLFNSIIHIFYIFCVKFHKNKNCLYLHVLSSNLEPNHGSIPCFFLHFFTFHTTEFLFMFCVLNGYGFAICLSYTFFFRRSSILSFYSHILLAFYNVYFKTINSTKTPRITTSSRLFSLSLTILSILSPFHTLYSPFPFNACTSPFPSRTWTFFLFFYF